MLESKLGICGSIMLRILRYSTPSGNFYVAADRSQFITQFENENLGVHSTLEDAVKSLSQDDSSRWMLMGSPFALDISADPIEWVPL